MASVNLQPSSSVIADSGDGYTVSGWHVQLSKHRISRNGKVKMLEPRLVKLLACLLDSANEIVTRKALEAAVWPNADIGYDTLSNTISKLRKALEESGSRSSAIETIPRVGYRLVLDDPPTKITPRILSSDKDNPPVTGKTIAHSHVYRFAMLLGPVSIALLVVAAVALNNDRQYQVPADLEPSSELHSNESTVGESDADSLLQSGWQNYLSKTPDGFIKAHHKLVKAVEMDPGNHEAKSMLAALYWETREKGWGLILGIGPEDLRNLTVNLLASHEVVETTVGQLVMSRISARLGEFHSALKTASRAYDLRNGDLESTYVLSELLLLSGDTIGALAIIEAYKPESELPDAGLLYLRVLASFHLGAHMDSIGYLTEASAISPSHANVKILLAATHAKLGRMEEATYFRREIEAKLAYCLPLVSNIVLQYFPYRHDAYVLHLADGLREAGLEG